jgi:hypothetical protein
MKIECVLLAALLYSRERKGKDRKGIDIDIPQRGPLFIPGL